MMVTRTVKWSVKNKMTINYTIKIFSIIVGSVIVICGISVYVINLQTSDLKHEIVITKTNVAKLISSTVATKFSEKITTLEIAGNNTYVQNTAYANYINASVKGIPSNMDLEKRRDARQILDHDKDFNVLFFVMPNGDMYMQEPYSAQVNNKVLNFAFRDWYKGAIANHATYVSEAYISQATDRKAVAISEPFYSSNGSLIGLWVGLINLDSLEHELSSLDLSHDRRIVIVDHNGNSVVDTSQPQDSKKLVTYANLESVKNALDGKGGSITETINGTQMFSVYEPIKIGTHTWAIVLMQPSDTVFGVILATMESSYLIIVMIVSIVIFTGFFMYRMFRSNDILTQKLLEADVKKEEFSTMITHELKTPLVTIDGYSEMLLEPGLIGILNSEQTNAVSKIAESSKKLVRLIADILDTQKLDLCKMRFDKKNFSLSEFMKEVVESFSPLMKNENIEFINSTTNDQIVSSDKNRLMQVFANLIKNSIDFVPKKSGRIEIGSQVLDNEIRFFVKDNGIGIPKEKQENLFKKFYQVDTSLNRRHGGTGLGLVICKGIIDGLGGRMWLDSDLGKGTTFWFSINNDGSMDQVK